MRQLFRVARWLFIVVLVLLLGLVAYVYVEGRPAHGPAQYVAMGSSFAAGPAISSIAENSPWFCSQSRDNYAHQLARLRGLALVDVSCGGATTRHILQGGQLMQPAQIDAVGAATELVTVTIGGNDIAYLGNIMALGCDATTPWFWRQVGACRARSTEEMELALREMRVRLGAIVDEVHRRAPAAKVVLLTYQTVLPDSGSCERLGLTEAQVTQMRTIGAELADATRETAQSHGALLFDAGQVTHGHDVCAQDSWMNAMRPEGGVLAAPLHPTLAGMTAVAAGLDALLEAAP